MDTSTYEILKECNSGCRMAVNSIEQLVVYLKNQELQELFSKYKEDYEKMKTLDKSSPTIDTYYNTGTIMAAQGNVVTVSGFHQGATMDWEYWVYNSDGSNVRDIGSHKVFGP